MTDQRSFHPLTRLARPAAASLLVGATLVAADPPVRAVDPAPVVNSTTSVLDVDVADADGVTSLADAVYLANTDAELDTITFDLDPADEGPIDTVNVPTIVEDLEIIGPGESRLTLTSSAAAAVLSVANDADFTLSEISIDGDTVATGPRDGIDLDEFGAAQFERVTFVDTGIAIEADQPVGDPVGSFSAAEVTISEIDGTGVSLNRVGSVTFDAVEASGAPNTGLRVEDATEVSITGGSVTGNLDGLKIVEVGDVTISEFAAIGNEQRGIVVTSGYGTSTLTGLAVSENGGVGLDIDATSATAPVGVDDLRDVSVVEAVFSSNDGGGISIQGAGELMLAGLEVTGNGVAPASGLGGVYLGPDATPSTATLEQSVISGNFGDGGGGITTNDHDGELTITESTISGNQAANGQAMRVASIAGEGLMIVDRSAISDHTAGPVPVVYADGVSVQIVDTNVTANEADALFNAANDEGLSIQQSTITGNSFGSAIFSNRDMADIEVFESTVTSNTATGGGAGVFLREVDGGDLIAVNSVLSGNGAPVAAPSSLAPAPSVTYSIVPTGTPAGLGNVVAEDPGVGPLADNGGPLPTMLPAEGSPGLDVGDPAGASSTMSTDQRGLTRVVNDRIDIGAVERQESPFVVGFRPARVLETRSGPTFETIDGEFEGIGRRSNGQELTLAIAGRAGVPPDAEAVVLNITAVEPSGVGFVTVHPCRVNPPLASSLNFRAGADNGNEIIAELDADGNICLFNRTATHLVADVVGYVPAQSRYSAVGPARLLDTRVVGATIDGLFEQGGIRQSDTELALDVAGRGGVSDDAVAVVVNITAAKPVDIGYVTAHPCLPEEPVAASLNFEPGVNRGNEIVAQLDDQGRLCLYTFGSAELVVDVVGELSSENVYTPVPPARLVETRDLPDRSVDGAQQGLGRLAAGEVLTVEAGGRAGVPAAADSVIVNTTVVRPDLGGFITVWDCTGTMPLASSLNYIAEEIVGNELVVALDDGEFCIFTNRATDLTVDVVAHLT